jgi:transcriptional regulator with XRE-family HTH domain
MQKCNLRRKDRIDMARIATKPHSKLGRVVAKAMADTGINALTVSRAAGVHHTTLWRWMTGSGSPRADQAAAIAKALGISADTFISSANTRSTKKKSATA